MMNRNRVDGTPDFGLLTHFFTPCPVSRVLVAPVRPPIDNKKVADLQNRSTLALKMAYAALRANLAVEIAQAPCDSDVMR